MVITPADELKQWTVSRYTHVSWRDGSVEIASPVSGVVFRSGTADVLQILHAFAGGRRISDVVAVMKRFAATDVIACIERLIDGEMVIEVCDAEPAGGWEPTALAYHRVSRRGVITDDGAQASVCAEGYEPGLIPLRAPEPIPRRDFADVLERRRTTRAWSHRPIAAQMFSALLWMSARNRGGPSPPGDRDSVSRPYPSGGAIHSLELYPVIGPAAVQAIPAGVYRYRPDAHALELLSGHAAVYEPVLRAGARAAGTQRAPLVLVVTSRIAEQSAAYSDIAYSLVLKEVGALFQTLYLVSECLGLAACAVGGGAPDTLFAQLTGSSTVERPVVGEFVVGPR
jgi:SagB-type dehydrogenase family enzyme